MLIIILSISLLVLIYSYDYMIEDPHFIRFYLFIILFIFTMIILITTTSLPILFIGWEGIYLCLKCNIYDLNYTAVAAHNILILKLRKFFFKNIY